MILLIVLGAGFFLLSILSVLAIYGMRRYLANAKEAEARNNVGLLGRDAVAAYEGDDEGEKESAPHELCASASHSVPASLSAVRGKKYMSSPEEWTEDAPKHAGFACLGFSNLAPQYYVYDYRATKTAFSATARGDLDGDGVASTFEIRGNVTGGAVLLSPSILESSPDE